MDPTQTPRVVVEPNAPRPSSMQVKQNPTLSPNFQVRQPGPLPGSPRYPIHNGSAAGPRLSGRPPPDLHRLDNRSTPGSPTGLPNQFVQQRPPFGPSRPQIAPGILPGNFPRALPPSANPSNQPILRYPNPAPSSNIRGPSYPPTGQRPPFNPNSQQFLRPQRPASFESAGGSTSHPRFGGYPQNLENRQVTPRIISDSAVTPLQSNVDSLKPMITIKDSDTHKIPQIQSQSREKMENNEQHSNVNIVDKEHETPKHRPTSRNTNEDNDTDDDDVIMDMEKNLSNVNLQPISPNKSEPTKSPTPSLHSDVKSIDGERSDSRMSIVNSPVTNNPMISNEQSLESLINNDQKSHDLNTMVKEGENNSTVENNSCVENGSGVSTNQRENSQSLKLGERSPDILASSPIPTSLTPSPDPITGVMGYDNGKLRSLSPKSTKSPSPAATPLTPNSPKMPDALSKAADEIKKANSFENIDDTDDTVNQFLQSPVAMLSVTEKFSPPPPESPKSSMIRSTPRRSIKSDVSGDNGINPPIPTTAPTNGVVISPSKKSPTKLREGDKSKSAGSPVKSPSKSIKSLSRTPDAGPPAPVEKKKVPMNKVQVGAAPSPNLKTVRSKIGSLDNTSYKPGGGKVKIENRKLDFSKAQPKIAAKNDKYAPSGGDKKITQVKLQWNAKPKVGSLDNATYKPGGGDKKIETVKLDFKDKAKPKVGSKENAKHVPGGGTIKSTVTPPKTPQELFHNIETQKIDIKAESKVGSMDNMKHRPGGGDKKIFNDRDYLRQTSSNVESVSGSGAQSPVPSIDSKNGLPISDENLNQEY